MTGHPIALESALTRFRAGRASRSENRDIVRHLLEGCGDCRAATSRLWPSGRETDLEEETDRTYDAVFRSLEGKLVPRQLELAEERAEVSALRSELAQHPHERQQFLIRNSQRFHSWALAESLLQDSFAWRRREPNQAACFAELGVTVAEHLPGERYGTERVADLLGRAWAELGSAYRAQNHLIEAENAFGRARAFLAAGTGDAVERASVLCQEASLRKDRRELGKALRLLDRVIAIAEKYREGQLQTRALVSKAECQAQLGRPEKALALLLEAQRLLDPILDPRLVLVVQHNILHALVQTGRFREAAAGLADTRALHRQLHHPVDRLRLDWLEALILHGLGQADLAERHYRSVVDGFLAEGLDYDAALVALELAVLYSEQGRVGAIEKLCAAMLPIFRSQKIGREAIAALLVFRQAVARERVSTDLLHRVAAAIRREGAAIRGPGEPAPQQSPLAS